MEMNDQGYSFCDSFLAHAAMVKVSDLFLKK